MGTNSQAQLPTAKPLRRYAIGVFDGWAQAKTFRANLVGSGVDPMTVGLFGTAECGGDRESRGPFARLASERVSAAELLTNLESALLPTHARFLADAVKTGRVLVWVEIQSSDQECALCLGMLKSSGRTVQIHDFGQP